MDYVYFLVAFIGQSLQSASAAQTAKVKTVIESIDLRNCSEPERYPNYMIEAGVHKPRPDFSYITSMFKVNVLSPLKLPAEVELFKCLDRMGNECESMIKVHMENICNNIKEKEAMWTPLFNSTYPTFVCPFQKTVYNMSKMYVDVEKTRYFMKQIPFITNFFWKLRAIPMKLKKPWACIEYVAKVNNVKTA